MTNIRGLQLRAIALPIGVAALSMAALAWYRLMWIPGQETYLNERNLRALYTTAAQIKAKVENFDLAIDHAIESSENIAAVHRYVPLLAPELRVIGEGEGERVIPTADASDPPRIAIERDEGRTVMFLAYERGNKELYAKADLEAAVRPFLATRSEFDAVFIADRRGQVIVPPSTPGLALAHLDELSETGRRDSRDASKGDAGLTFENLRGATTVSDVTFGATAYKLYVHPIQLSLKARKDDLAAKPKDVGTAQDEQEEWALCGLARADRFRAASSALVTTYWLWLGLGLASVVLAIPVLKLRVLSPRERLRSADGVIVAGTAVIVIALTAFALLDARYFGWIVPSERDAQLEALGTRIVGNFRSETAAIDDQMTAFDPDTRDPHKNKNFWIQELNYGTDTVLPELRRRLDTQDVKNPCKPEWACRDALLGRMSSPDDRQTLLHPMLSLDDRQALPYPLHRRAPRSVARLAGHGMAR
jgi:hypothetical protein